MLAVRWAMIPGVVENAEPSPIHTPTPARTTSPAVQARPGQRRRAGTTSAGRCPRCRCRPRARTCRRSPRVSVAACHSAHRLLQPSACSSVVVVSVRVRACAPSSSALIVALGASCYICHSAEQGTAQGIIREVPGGCFRGKLGAVFGIPALLEGVLELSLRHPGDEYPLADLGVCRRHAKNGSGSGPLSVIELAPVGCVVASFLIATV
jgi:hypothetical protein